MNLLENRTFITLVFVLVLRSFTDTKDLYSFIISRMLCEDFDPRIIYNHSCKMERLSRNEKVYSALVIPYPNKIFNELYVHVSYLQRAGNIYRKSIISMEENFCGFLAGTSKSFLISILWPSLKKSSNLKDKCPYSGPMNVSRMVFDESFLPPALPEGQARLDIHVRNGPLRMSVIKVKFFIEIKPKGAIKLDF